MANGYRNEWRALGGGLRDIGRMLVDKRLESQRSDLLDEEQARRERAEQREIEALEQERRRWAVERGGGEGTIPRVPGPIEQGGVIPPPQEPISARMPKYMPEPMDPHVVDRIEGDQAVMIRDADAQAVDVSVGAFPEPPSEGMTVNRLPGTREREPWRGGAGPSVPALPNQPVGATLRGGGLTSTPESGYTQGEGIYYRSPAQEEARMAGLGEAAGMTPEEAAFRAAGGTMPTPPTPRNIDPLSDAGIAAAVKRAAELGITEVDFRSALQLVMLEHKKDLIETEGRIEYNLTGPEMFNMAMEIVRSGKWPGTSAATGSYDERVAAIRKAHPDWDAEQVMAEMRSQGGGG